jgi:hypothetical protein
MMEWIVVASVILVNFLVNVFWKPYLKTYAEEAAREFAKSERFQDALKQLELTTRRTTEIQSEIAGGLWLSQWRISQKRDGYVRLIEVIENWQLLRSESRRRRVSMTLDEEHAIDEFRRARSVARLMLDPRVVDGIGPLVRDIRLIDPLQSEDHEFELSKKRIESARDHVVRMGKAELKLAVATDDEGATLSPS